MINPFDFEQLIAPISSKEFFEEYWEKKPLVLNKKREGYQNLLTLKDLDFLLFSLIPDTIGSASWVRFMNNKKKLGITNYLNKSGAFNRQKVIEGFEQGNTIELIHPEERFEPLTKFCSEMEKIFGHGVHTVVFLSPPHSQAFGPHCDALDIFTMQLEGKKHWKIYELTQPFPLSPNGAPFRGEIPKPVYEIELNPGDLLYLPSGFVHEVYTSDELSLHLSVDIQISKWVDLIYEVIVNEMEFRKALPIGALNSRTSDKIPLEPFEKIAELFSDRNKIERAFKKVQAKFTKSKNIPFDASFGCKQQDREISADTFFKKRDGLVCTFITENDQTTIHFGHEEITAPSHIESSLEYIIDADRFSVHSMPDNLTEAGNVTLVKTLLKAGLLEVDNAKPSDVLI